MSTDTRNAFATGLVILVGVFIALAFFVKTKKSTLNSGNSTPYYAFLTDASGVNAKSLITIAGLQVGEIDDITLVAIKLGELAGHERKQAEEDHRIALAKWQTKVDRFLAKWRERHPGQDDPDLPKTLTLDRPNELPDWEPERIVRVARVDMHVRSDLKVPVDSWLKKESLGLLGSNALFLEIGRPGQPIIESGGRIINVRSVTQMNGLIAKADGIVDNLESITTKIDEDVGGITSDIHTITDSLADFMAGDGENPPLDELYAMVLTDVRRVTNTINKAVRDVDKLLVKNDGSIASMLANIDRITADIAELTGAPGEGGEGGGDIRLAMADVRKITQDLAGITGTLSEVLNDNEGDVEGGVKELKHTISEMNRSLTSLAEVTGRIERGEGAVGKLLSDKAMGDKLEEAINGASDYVSSLTSIETHVDLGVYYPFRRQLSVVNFQIRIQPRPDKFYLFEVVDDGGGLERLTQITPGATGDRLVQREEDNQIRITAMFGKRFFDFIELRAGLIETSGGVGADLYFWDDRIHLRSDVFNIGGPRNYISGDSGDPLLADTLYLPRWRSWLKVQPIPHIYMMAGVDDALNWQTNPQGPQGYGIDYFFGVGISFVDSDLRTILPFIPSL